MPIYITGLSKLETITPNITKAFMVAAKEISEEVINEAQRFYMEKKRSSGPSKLIFNSFTYAVHPVMSLGEGEVRSYILAGGNKAPYAKWVDEGHMFKKHSGSFPGHHFIKAGAAKGREEAGRITLEALRKYTSSSGGITFGATLSSETGIK